MDKLLIFKKISFCFFFILLAHFFNSCKKDSNLSPEIKLPDEVVEEIPSGLDTLKSDRKYLIENMQYGTHNLNSLDICLPKNRDLNTPVIIFIHGGGWEQDDKFYFRADIQEFADSGFACVSINYRLADTLLNVNMNSILNDVDSALLFIVNNASKFKISNNKIGLTGHSAGGHLALMTSYTSSLNSHIKACASISGPTDLLDSTQRTDIFWFNAVIRNAIGTGLNTNSDTVLYKKYSPFWNVNLNCKPTLLIHGMADNIILFRNSTILQQKLNDFFVFNSLILLPNKDHYIWGDSKYSMFQWFKQRL